jgi:PKD repeat protein
VTAVGTIDINPYLPPSVTVPTGSNPQNSIFRVTHSVTGVYGYDWRYSDGTSETTYTPTAIKWFHSPGTYTVACTVYGSSGTETASITDTFDGWSYEFRSIVTYSSDPLNVLINANGGTYYSGTLTVMVDVDLGDGTTVTQGASEAVFASNRVAHTYTTSGNYTVTATFTYFDHGTLVGTQVAIPLALTVSNGMPIAGFTATPVTGTPPLEVSFTDTSTDPGGSIAMWFWSFGDGEASTLQNPTHTYTAAGTFNTSLVIYDNDLNFATANSTITVEGYDPLVGPTAHITTDGLQGFGPFELFFNANTSTPGDAVITDKFWDFGDGQTSEAYEGAHTYNASGLYTVTLTVTDANGLTDTDTVTVTVLDPEVDTTIVPSDDFFDALRYSHRAFTRVVLRTPDCKTYELPIIDGSITIDRNAKTRRSAELTIAIDQLGTDTRDALEKVTVQAGEIEIYTGVTYEDSDTEEILIARMRVDSLDRDDSAAARLGAYDYALMLDEHPVDPATGATIPAGTDWRIAIRRLIEDTFTWTPCGWSTLFAVHPDVPAWGIPDQAWDNVNRLSAILEWAEAKECDFYNLPDGRFYLAPKNDDGDPVWTVNAGSNGVLVKATQKFSREQQYNAVAISFQVPDGIYESIRAFVVDEDPYSPTRWGGPFGKRVLTLDSIPAKDEDEARSIAIRKLNENKGATRALTLTTLRNPSLLPGQVILVDHPMIDNERQVIEKVVHQLGRGTSEIDCTLSRR